MISSDKFCRLYGVKPASLVLIHGGPGARGEMASCAEYLSNFATVAEHLQFADTIEGQTEELEIILNKYCSDEAILIGHSWGAWLAVIFAALYPEKVRGLILSGTPPPDAKGALQIEQIRLSHLSQEEQKLFKKMCGMKETFNPTVFMRLLEKTDCYEKNLDNPYNVDVDWKIMNSVWSQAEKLRESKNIFEFFSKLKCPTAALHGDYDPHPAESVKALSGIIENFDFILLEKCGHTPWIEKYASERFYDKIRRTL